MARNTINRYIWLVDTIDRYGHITLKRLSDLWQQSSLGDGVPLPRRTFNNYRNAIEEVLGVTIACNRSTYEYYIEQDNSEENERLQNWLMDSMSISGMLTDSRDVASRIVLETVPSARQHLPVIIEAMRRNQRITFSYKTYTRANGKHGVIVDPYFVKIFKQLWYVIGRNVKDQSIKTYALDRMSDLHVMEETFDMPKGFSPTEFFKDCFGITTNQNEPKNITLRVESTQAKYFRALPLHPSQTEEVHDNYSVFHYRMRLTYDLRERLLSHGSNMEVVSPPELKAQIVDELKRALKQYIP